jgi:glutathione S-transferase
MPQIPVLYSFRRCPYAMRARMALLASGTIYEHREVRLSNKPDAMLAASPKGTVPVLVLVDGTVVDESIDIMRWALSQHDPEDWLPRFDNALIETFDEGFKHHLDRYKYAARYDDGVPMAHFAQGLAMLIELDKRLAEHPYLGGASRGFDDIALFPFIRQFSAVDDARFSDLAPQRVREWLEIFLASELFQRTMVKLAPWRDESEVAPPQSWRLK